MAVRQTRIYAPLLSPYNDDLWAETMMARIIRPLVQMGGLNWFWFTRYASEELEFADSDGTNVPVRFFEGQACRSLRFRFDMDDSRLNGFEASAATKIREENCWIADFRDYGDQQLCESRFLGEDQSDARKKERLAIVREYTQSICRLTLHALVPADEEGRFRFEIGDKSANPHGSAFFSFHHLFCNTTDVFLTVIVASDGSNLSCGTRQYVSPPLQKNPTVGPVEIQVRF